MMNCNQLDIKKICGFTNVGWTFQQVVGSKGGMLILWDKDFVEINGSLAREYTLSVSCTYKSDNFKWMLTNVYGPYNPVERKDFWVELDNTCRLWDLPWCIGGDFNTVKKCDEKKNCYRITRSMTQFNKFIEEHELIDLPLKGARYIWSNGQSNPVMCRLDRFLISPSFETHYPFITQLAKSRPTSNHIPILIDISDPSWGPSPFRFEVMWFLENGFLQLLENWWLSFDFAEDKTLSEEEINKMLSLKTEFEKTTHMKKVSWKIKSKTQWLQEGDKNTSFFISKASDIRRHNRIKQLYINGALVDEKIILQDHIVNYYNTLFTEEEIIRPNLEDIVFDKINTQECDILDAEFSEEEVIAAIKDLGSDKAPGPDGQINSKHNFTFITLVPKKDYVETIEGTQIIYGTLIANELVDSRIRSGKAGIICKIDLEKAFDRINWKYLEVVMLQMGFSSKLCKWLRFCYSTSTFSVLINGSSFGFFSSSRGVRQGCPVSPILFNIAMEGFSRYMDRASQLSLFSGFSVTTSSITVNHLHYADDTIFFIDHSKEELINLFSALKYFEFISSLKVNTSKTRLITIGEVPELSVWAVEFGCATDNLPFMYLGMPLGAKPNSKHIWDHIIEKFEERLSLWRQISLSKGGKLALLKCILCSLPIYYFSLFKAPVSVIKILEKKMKNFLWENGIGSKVSHLINWGLVCADKERGGLGMRNLKIMNQCMLAKWCWRFGQDKNRLWYNIIVDKHGREISFWNDIWSGNISLALDFPALYRLACSKTSKLADMISTNGNWKFDFKRYFSSLEANDFAQFLLRIGSNPPELDNLSDTRRWTLNSSGTFSIKSLYAKLVEGSGLDDFPYGFVWHKSIPPKINFMVWCIIHERLNTIDNLQNKGVDIYNSCALCGDDTKSHDHIFLHCKIAHKICCSGLHNLVGENKCTFEPNHTFKTEDDLGLEVTSSVLAWEEAAGRRVHLNFLSTVHNTWDAIFV
ncbi:uncharacterized protein LOC113331002 [Papaver somniferum]|uniref:uncharacterized protein LOC113331002 n=1 Tax=Papaver somniferum TaxID=3469 RepID=UPI000E6F9270|nr:uncharacterized protein LOC113331002 [Papaver somniferum]